MITITKSTVLRLSPEVSDILKGFVRQTKLPAAVQQRAEIILEYAEGLSNQQVARELNISRNVVSKWKNRFILSGFGQGETQSEHKEEFGKQSVRKVENILLDALSDSERSGHPPKFTPEQIFQIQNLACELPTDHGIEAVKWTLEDLVRKAEELKIVNSISPAAIGRFLKDGLIRPHMYRYWLNSTDKKEKPEEFNRKVKQICGLYLAAAELYEGGYYVVCGDEMTGIQAKERIHPDKPVSRELIKRIEFEYRRHGTTTMIAFFMIATGQVFEPYINPTRKEKDFVEAVQAVVNTRPESHWIFVVDGLNTHKSEALIRYINKVCGIEANLGIKGFDGILKNMESRADFLSNPKHKIFFVYTPKHCSWMNQIEIWFSSMSRRLLKNSSYKSAEDLVYSILRYVEEYNKRAHPYKWNYKGA